MAAMLLGAGARDRGVAIDLAVGVVLRKKVGDPVEAGEPLAELHVNSEKRLAEAQARLAGAYRIGGEQPPEPPLVYGLVTTQGTERWASGQRSRRGHGVPPSCCLWHFWVRT